ncbi:hypothetical protein OAL51_02370, partial [bacterium]|nr:hypothetical protein [bacterium]
YTKLKISTNIKTDPETCQQEAGRPDARSLIDLIWSPDEIPRLYFLNGHPKKMATVSSRHF